MSLPKEKIPAVSRRYLRGPGVEAVNVRDKHGQGGQMRCERETAIFIESRGGDGGGVAGV